MQHTAAMGEVSPQLGALFSLSCALTWAYASVGTNRVMMTLSVSPWALNVLRCLGASLLLWPLMLAFGVFPPSIDTSLRAPLLLSVLLGVVLSDTAYFLTLARLGVGRGVLFVPLVPVATSLGAALFLSEQLTLSMVAGGALTLLGLLLVLWPSSGDGSPKAAVASWRGLSAGLASGLVYVAAQAGSNVLQKHVLTHALPLHVAALRIAAGAFIMSLYIASRGHLRREFRAVASQKTRHVLWLGAIGTGCGVWFGAVGNRALPMGVSTTLAATTPIWAMLLARRHGVALPPRALTGGGIALVGVAVLVFAR